MHLKFLYIRQIPIIRYSNEHWYAMRSEEGNTHHGSACQCFHICSVHPFYKQMLHIPLWPSDIYIIIHYYYYYYTHIYTHTPGHSWLPQTLKQPSCDRVFPTWIFLLHINTEKYWNTRLSITMDITQAGISTGKPILFNQPTTVIISLRWLLV